MTGTIQVQEPVQLEEYGDREEIKELGFRLQQMMPGAQSFNQSEALAVAQIAVAHDLNPFNGEVWGIKGNGKWYGVMVGIKGLRKEARRQVKEEGGSYWTDYKRVSPKEYDEPESSIVYECDLRDSVSLGEWKDLVHSMTSMGMPYSDAVKSAGPAPVYTGVGIVEANERSKMHKHALAKKRAEADAIKKRFDVEFKGARYDARHVDSDGPMIVNGEYKDASPQILEPESSGKSNEQLLEELGYDTADMPDVGVVEEQDEDPAWNGDGVVAPENLKEVLDLNAEMYAGQKAQPQHSKMLANHLNTTFDGSKEKRYEWSEYYLGARSTKNIEDKYILGTLKTFMGCNGWGDVPEASAVKSIKQSHSYALKQLGQKEMEL